MFNRHSLLFFFLFQLCHHILLIQTIFHFTCVSFPICGFRKNAIWNVLPQLWRRGLYNRTRIYHIVCSNNHTFIRFLQCAFNLVLLQREFEILKWTTLKFSMGFWVNRFHMIDPIQLEFYFVSSININECILLIRFLIVHGPSAHGPAQEKRLKIILSLIWWGFDWKGVDSSIFLLMVFWSFHSFVWCDDLL